MPDNCCVDGCANVRSRQLDIGFFRIPAIPKKASKPEIKELLSTRRNAWLMAIGRTDVSNPKHWKVCGKHFISGEFIQRHCLNYYNSLLLKALRPKVMTQQIQIGFQTKICVHCESVCTSQKDDIENFSMKRIEQKNHLLQRSHQSNRNMKLMID